MPADLGRNKERAEVFLGCWRHWLGPSELQFTPGSDAGHEALAVASTQAGDYEVAPRRVWT
ncbi:MAG TPA: hypothetical protein VMD59_15130 [Acidimicrobiales bacterium]|nr:hypothetical protein [Acidimicrobiales bacterium]